MKPNYQFVLDSVHLLADTLADRLYFNATLSVVQAWEYLDDHFRRFDLTASSEETQELIGVLQAHLATARMKRIKQGVAQEDAALLKLIHLADSATATPET